MTPNIHFDSIGQECVTFRASGNLAAGVPCKVSANGTVAAATSGDFMGVTRSAAKGGVVAVQLRGFVTLKYSGTAPTVGYSTLAAATGGKVKVDESAMSRLVVSVDEDNTTACVLL